MFMCTYKKSTNLSVQDAFCLFPDKAQVNNNKSTNIKS